MIKCDECDGKGYIEGYGAKIHCHVCNGKGKIDDPDDIQGWKALFYPET